MHYSLLYNQITLFILRQKFLKNIIIQKLSALFENRTKNTKKELG